MASASPGGPVVSRITVYDLKVKRTILGQFKKYILENLNGSTFISNTPLVIQSQHELIGIDKEDCRQMNHSQIQSKLSRFLNRTYVLRIAIPNGPCFSQVKASQEVSIF